MASAFGHAYAAIALGKSFPKSIATWKFWLLGIACAILPDGDVIGFKLGVHYADFWGHRGFTHSLLFALLTGLVVTALFYKEIITSKKGIVYILFFTLCTASHSLLDGMTSGGLGVAYFSPFNNSRYFLPWRPIKVSPIGVANFFSSWGKTVLLSELIWIGIPCTLYILIMRLVKK